MKVDASTFRDLATGRMTGFWPSVMRAACTAGEIPYRWAVAIRNRYYDSAPHSIYRAAVPVVSVGNLTMGGTGKTPMVAWLARWMRSRGIRVAILSRGYGAEQGARNDEALELEKTFPDVPHLQDPNRVASARIAVEELDSQVLVLDDGFQHRQLHRDLEIVLIDASQPVGFERLVPRGFYREPPTALRRADIVVLSRCDMVSSDQRAWLRKYVQRINPQVQVVEARHEATELVQSDGELLSLDPARGMCVAAFCGIGHPRAFWHSLDNAGLKLTHRRSFPDHHAYTAADISDLQSWAMDVGAVEAVICTCKDLVKIGLTSLRDKPLWALRVEMEIPEAQPLETYLEQRIRCSIPRDLTNDGVQTFR